MSKPARKTMAEQMGIDTSVCEICEEPLGDDEEWKEGMDGARAHVSCLRSMGVKV